MAKGPRITADDLRAAIAYAQAERDRLSNLPNMEDVGSYNAWRLAWDGGYRKVLATLEPIGFVFGGSSDNRSVKFAGIRSTSTGDLHGALSNWLRAARARLETMEASDA